jgi:hypothetical protein
MDSKHTQESLAKFLHGIDYLSWRAREIASELAAMHREIAYMLEELKKPEKSDALAPTKKT